jgi:hypothetical protein
VSAPKLDELGCYRCTYTTSMRNASCRRLCLIGWCFRLRRLVDGLNTDRTQLWKIEAPPPWKGRCGEGDLSQLHQLS